MALPNAAASGPRIVDGGFATTSAGVQIQSTELESQVKKASGALLAVAILQCLGGVVLYFLFDNMPGMEEVPAEARMLVLVVAGAIAALFFGLYLWSRKNPFPAAVVGLVVFITIIAAAALMDPATICSGIIIKVIVLIILIRAVQAGVQHRRLKQLEKNDSNPF